MYSWANTLKNICLRFLFVKQNSSKNDLVVFYDRISHAYQFFTIQKQLYLKSHLQPCSLIIIFFKLKKFIITKH